MANELVLLTRYGGLSPNEVWNARTPVTPEEREHFKNHLQKEREDGLRKMWAEMKDTATDKQREEALAKTERDAVRRTLESSGLLTERRKRIPLPKKR